MKIIESFLTNNKCYKTKKTITVKGLMLHSVGCSNPNASRFIKSWNSTTFNRSVCVHAFIDANTGDVYQTLPWNHRGWHCGSGKNGSGNNTHIGVEMCEPPNIKYTGGANFTCSDPEKAKTYVMTAYNSAVELFVFLCKEYNLDPLADGVIISHKEGSKRGIASGHGDPDHLFKQLKMDVNMGTFRKAVYAVLKGSDEVV